MADNMKVKDPKLPLYLPLMEDNLIRLLNLMPGSHKDRISIHILIVELSHHPSYEALSYVWGNASDRVDISCNGRPLSVTKNLHHALQRLRYPDRERLLWVDAVCINQGNKRERSHHISFMNLIFEGADTVIIDMGDDHNESGKQVVSLVQDHITRSLNYNTLDDMPLISATDPILSDSRWKAVATLLKQPWFSRAWVIQEVGLAKVAMAVYGDSEFNYRDFIRLLKWSIRCASQLEARYDFWWWTIHVDWYDWSKPPDTPSARDLLVFLYQAKAVKCTDPRDKIYAFLGHYLMRSEDGKPFVVPNYEEHVSLLYLEIARRLLSSDDTRILASVEHDEQTFASGVSWVPRWDVSVLISDFGVLPENYYRFSGRVKADGDTIKIYGKKLEIRCIRFDAIRKSFRFPSRLNNPGAADENQFPTPQYLRSLRGKNVPHGPSILGQAWSEVKNGNVKYLGDNARNEFDAFGLTLCASRTTYSYIPVKKDIKQHRNNFASYWKLWQSVMSPADPVTDLGGTPEEGDADQFVLDLNQSCEGRTFVTTEKGYIGLAPWIAQPGDELFWILGSNVPFVLRRGLETGSLVEGTRNTFRLVGEAFLNGLMDGEVCDIVELENLVEETIVVV